MTQPDAALDLSDVCRRIVEGAGDGVLYAGRDGVIRFWNAGCEAIFGWSAAEAVGQSMDLIIPERLRGRHWHGWDQVMASGVTRYGRDLLAVPAARKDGAPLSIEFTIQLLRDPSGAVEGASAIVRDVTARWTKERETRKRVADLEARLAAAAPKSG
jgi:PAS domain S-box-containing protein